VKGAISQVEEIGEKSVSVLFSEMQIQEKRTDTDFAFAHGVSSR
jgi:hypothetical protein